MFLRDLLAVHNLSRNLLEFAIYLLTISSLGERCKLPQWGLGRSPSRQTIWCISGPKGAALVTTVLWIFVGINLIFW